jgi:hypothetical protein
MIQNSAYIAARHRALALGQGTPVDLKLMFWGVSLVAIAAYLLGSGGEMKPRRKTQRDSSGGRTEADAEAVSALVNLGYTRADSTRAVLAAQRSGARGFNAIFERAQRRLE